MCVFNKKLKMIMASIILAYYLKKVNFPDFLLPIENKEKDLVTKF